MTGLLQTKKKRIQSGLAIDAPMTFYDRTVAALTIGEKEAARTVNFDETDDPLSTEYDNCGNNALINKYLKCQKGAQRGTRNIIITQ